MIVFWLACVLMIAGALAAVLPPLLRGQRAPGVSWREASAAQYAARLAELDADLRAGVLDAAAHRQARDEIGRLALGALEADAPAPVTPAPLANSLGAVVVAVAVPALAFGLYLLLGSPALLTAAPPVPAAPPDGMPHEVVAMVDRLEARLRANPADAEGWAMLGRSRLAMNRQADAVQAFAEAARQAPGDGRRLADLAEAQAIGRGGDLRGEPAQLLANALAMAPDEPKVLWLAGVAAYQAADFPRAVDLLERLQAAGGLPGAQAPLVADLLAAARSGHAAPDPLAAPASAPRAAAGAPGARLEVRVALDAAFAARVSPDETVYVYARAVDGPRIPVAIVRRQVRDLPLVVTLDDSLAMSAALKLSAWPRVDVGARVAKAGTATRTPGDFEGRVGPVEVAGAAPVTVTIDTVVE